MYKKSAIATLLALTLVSCGKSEPKKTVEQAPMPESVSTKTTANESTDVKSGLTQNNAMKFSIDEVKRTLQANNISFSVESSETAIGHLEKLKIGSNPMGGKINIYSGNNGDGLVSTLKIQVPVDDEKSFDAFASIFLNPNILINNEEFTKEVATRIKEARKTKKDFFKVYENNGYNVQIEIYPPASLVAIITKKK